MTMPRARLLRRTFSVSLAALVGLGASAARADGEPARAEAFETSGMLGYERVKLPDGEVMGLVGGSVLFDVGSDWGLGPAVYGAATGRRGGLFVGGIELQKRFALARGVTLATGFFAGGGGGAAAPVGDGLMLRPAATLLYDLGSSLQAGVSLSHVRFPTGSISSTQLGLTLAWRSDFTHYPQAGHGDPVVSTRASGLGFDRMVGTLGAYDLAGGTRPRIGLVGARAEKRSTRDGLVWGLEAAGAASGDAAGYMEILGTAGISTALFPDELPSWRIGLRTSGGLGGGGAVPTEGGVIGKVTATTEISPLRGWTVGAEIGVLRGLGSALRGRHAQVWVGFDLEPGLDGRGEPIGRVTRTEWSAALQHHSRVKRNNGTEAALDTIGLKLSRYLGNTVYLTGQAHTAYGGGAGAYAIGLVGLGAATPHDAPFRAGVEALAGAAGGGGVSAEGGRLVQGLAWAGWKPSRDHEFRIGVGQMRFAGAGARSPTVELSWTRTFGMAGR